MWISKLIPGSTCAQHTCQALLGPPIWKYNSHNLSRHPSQVATTPTNLPVLTKQMQWFFFNFTIISSFKWFHLQLILWKCSKKWQSHQKPKVIVRMNQEVILGENKSHLQCVFTNVSKLFVEQGCWQNAHASHLHPLKAIRCLIISVVVQR